jgi:hypothetical protein
MLAGYLDSLCFDGIEAYAVSVFGYFVRLCDTFGFDSFVAFLLPLITI